MNNFFLKFFQVFLFKDLWLDVTEIQIIYYPFIFLRKESPCDVHDKVLFIKSDIPLNA